MPDQPSPVTDDRHCFFRNHGMFYTSFLSMLCWNTICRVVFVPRLQRELRASSSKNSPSISLKFLITLDTHTVTPVSPSISTPTNVSSMKWSVNFSLSDNWNNPSTFFCLLGRCSFQTSAKQSRRFHDTLDEAYPKGTRSWYFVQTPRRRTWTQRQLRSGSVCFGYDCGWYRSRSWNQGAWSLQKTCFRGLA